MDLIPLHTREWTVHAVGDLSRVPKTVRDRVVTGIPARLLPEVGSCVHTDLMDAGVILDPAIGDNELAVEWVSWTDWCYQCVFELGGAEAAVLAHHAIELVFESLDTIAAIELNDVEVGTAASEFIPWRFKVKGVIKSGANTLRVKFTSSLRAAYELANEQGRPHNGDQEPAEKGGPWHPYNMLRKCASNFGWDWGPRVATCGITGEARIEAWSHVRPKSPAVIDPCPRNSADHSLWFTPAISQRFLWSAESDTEEAHIRHTLRVPGVEDADIISDMIMQGADPSNPLNSRMWDAGMALFPEHAWNPVGYGDPVLIRVESDLTIPTVSGPRYERGTRTLDHSSWSFGVRAVDYLGSELWINGRQVFCKGANWIPEGLWPRDRTRAKIRARLEQAKAAGMNMIRVWGGGRYESDAFYEICDELGLMVWQDFMFACALYPEEEPFRSLVEAEARHQVARLSKHPCVVLWCGGNENHWAYQSWGFKERLKPGQTWGKGYWQELLPRIIRELSPHTPYVPDSPWSPPPNHPNDAAVGDRHTWDLFGPEFVQHVPTFCSEFGVQSPSNFETLLKADLVNPPDQPSPANQPDSSTPLPPLDRLLRRQRGPGGMTRWYDEFFAKAALASPGVSISSSFPAWHAAAQQLQADWLYLAITWLRANWPHCGGALVWQLNDAWPGFSWSLIDSAGREKPAYYAVKAAFADRLLATLPFGGVPHYVAINDTEEPWEAAPGWIVAPRSVSKRPAGSSQPACS